MKVRRRQINLYKSKRNKQQKKGDGELRLRLSQASSSGGGGGILQYLTDKYYEDVLVSVKERFLCEQEQQQQRSAT